MSKQGQAIPVNDDILGFIIDVQTKRNIDDNILLVTGTSHDDLLTAAVNNPDIETTKVSDIDIVVKFHDIPVLIVGAGFIQEPFALCTQQSAINMGLIREVNYVK